MILKNIFYCIIFTGTDHNVLVHDPDVVLVKVSLEHDHENSIILKKSLLSTGNGFKDQFN